ncbi:MAG: hypothetical protein U5Q44_16565 [Dehalococcoidia bacterium]|nr:hypothetical protein [Dehalococcoidia bacterium]
MLRRRRYFQGREIRGSGIKDIAWLKPDAAEMGPPDWSDPERRCLGMWLAGEATDVIDDRGQTDRRRHPLHPGELRR